MGQYKVPQNVEAEDHILGPLTFKQFIYGMIGFGWGVLCFATLRWSIPLMLVIGLPPSILFLLLAFYTRDGQNFEQILIAMAGFFAASRKRIWVKEEVAEMYHVEATKVAAEISQRNGIAVKSELEKLATLIDSRGWNYARIGEATHALPTATHADRLVAPPPPSAPAALSEPRTDMLDLTGSPLAQNLGSLLQEAAASTRQQALSQMGAAGATIPLPAGQPSAPGAPTMPVAAASPLSAPMPTAVPPIGAAPMPAPTPSNPLPMPSPLPTSPQPGNTPPALAMPTVPTPMPGGPFGPAAMAPTPGTVAPAPGVPTLAPLPQLSTSGVTPAAPHDIMRLATQSDDLTVSQVAAQATRLAPNAASQG